MKRIVFVGILCVNVLAVYAQEVPLSVKMTATAMSLWPAGSPSDWNYEQGLVMKSVETVWERTGDVKYLQYIQNKVNYFVGATGNISTYSMANYELDDIASGRALLFLYKNATANKYKIAADKLRSHITAQPRTASGGFWHKNNYPNQMWLDGLYMAGPYYAEYSSLFNQPTYFDDVAKQFILMEKKSRDNQTGLLYHAWDESKQMRWADPITGCSPSFWGRAMGWYVMGLVDALDYIPENHSKRDSLIQILQRAAIAIEKYQEPQTGLWYQVLDKAGQAGNYREASAASMFVYALAKGVRKGYLQPSFMQKAKTGYDSLVSEFVETDNLGKVHLNGTCTATGLGGNPYRNGTYEYYIGVSKAKDDPRGVGAFILASVEIERNEIVLGMEPSALNEVTVYPNPFEEKFTINALNGNAFSTTVYNSMGTSLFTSSHQEIDLGEYPSGIYVIIVESGTQKIVKRVVKK